MREIFKEKLDHASEFVLTFLKWVAIAFFVGAVCGVVGSAFCYSINFGAGLFSGHSFLVWLLPVAGLLTVLLYRICRVPTSVGTDAVIGSVNSDKKVPICLAPLIFVCTVLSHLCGGSVGREGAALQFGGSIGVKIGQLLHLDEKDLNIITICGMGGVFAAVFGTPLTAAFFAMEVISVGVIYFSSFIPSVVTALTAYKISLLLGVPPLSFKIPAISGDVTVYLKTVLLAAACAILSIVFCLSLHTAHKYLKKYIKNEYIRIAAGGLLIALLTTVLGTTDYNGAGVAVIAKAISGEALPQAFILKMLFTVVTVAVGFKGGEIIPTFFIGATFGCVVGGLIGLDPAFSAAIGIIALFCGVTNSPIASIVLSVELFGSADLLPFAVAAGVSYMLSGYYGLYSSQRIIYSKTKTEYINILAK